MVIVIEEILNEKLFCVVDNENEYENNLDNNNKDDTDDDNDDINAKDNDTDHDPTIMLFQMIHFGELLF